MAILTCALCDQPIARAVPADGQTFCCHGCRDLWRILGEDQVTALRAHDTLKWSTLGTLSSCAQAPDETSEQAEWRHATLSLSGVWCASCGVLIEHVVRKLPGVYGARVDAGRAVAAVTFDAGLVSAKAICTTITELGYEAVDSGELPPEVARKTVTPWHRLAITATLSFIVMMLSIPVWMGYLPVLPAGLRFALTGALWALSTPVILWGGWPFLKGALTSIRHMVATMDLLIAIGALTAYSYGVYGALSGGRYYYFDTADMLVVFLLLGRSLETASRSRADKLLASLGTISVSQATKIEDGQDRQVPVTSLRIGDRVHIRPGQRVPIDGTVVGGTSSVDEAILTGEALPARKRAGQVVYAGSMNCEGRLVVEVTRPWEDSVLAQTKRMVQSAELGSARMRAMVDRVLHWFVPTVLTIGSATFLVDLLFLHLHAGEAMVHAAAIFIIACPCALSVATPLALSAAAYRLARAGILIRGPHAFENLALIDTVILDKTGTLTQGVMRLAEMTPDEPQLLQWAASAEYPSEHPIARALVEACQTRHYDLLPAHDFCAVPGWGVRAKVDGHLVEVHKTDSLEPPSRSLPYTQCALTVDGQRRAHFALRDQVRSDAAIGVARLQALGLRVFMATGDVVPSAESVAHSLQIAHWRARTKPADKAHWVEELQTAGHHVLFAGDGVNDANALLAADVGIAIGTKTDIAAQSGDLLQVSARIDTLADMLLVGRMARRVVRQNFAWAIGYNTVALLLAITGVATPLLAALAMVLSSLFVLLNSLRIVDDTAQRATRHTVVAAAWLSLLVALAWLRI